MRAVDTGQELMELFVAELRRRLTPENAPAMTAAELAVVLKLMSDNSITLSSVRKGDFGEFAQKVADEQFPFDEGDRASYQ